MLFSGDGDPNEYLLENWYYLNQWVNQEPVLRKITADVDAAGQLKSEDEIHMFIIAFRSMAKTLATLKTFLGFDWDDLAVVMDENVDTKDSRAGICITKTRHTIQIRKYLYQ